MQLTQIHKKNVLVLLVNTTSKQVWIWDSRHSLDEHISITANILVLKYTMKYFKALEQIFYVIPADKISWSKKWHFAPLWSPELEVPGLNPLACFPTSCNFYAF